MPWRKCGHIWTLITPKWTTCNGVRPCYRPTSTMSSNGIWWFCLYMTGDSCLAFYDHLVNEFDRLTKITTHHRSAVFPRCTQYRAMGEKLAYVMALCALLNPVKSRLMPLEQLLQLSDYSINCGVRDGLLNASQTQGQAQPNGKLSLTYTEPSQPYCPFPNCIKWAKSSKWL